MPSQKYVRAPEILDHPANRHAFRPLRQRGPLDRGHARLDDTTKLRIIRMNGDEMRAKFVAKDGSPPPAEASGDPGDRDLRGHSFHTSRWDYEYTGGNPASGLMTGLADKRVGIIGPVRRQRNASRICPQRRASCSCFSERLRRSTSAITTT